MRAIGEDGTQLGVMPVREALRVARDQGLDLVLVAPEASPPVCRIMDYGRHRFEQEKRVREARKKQRVIENKELTLSYKIGEHDYQVRLRHIFRFLKAGNKVKLTVRLRGREAQHQNLAIHLLLRFANDSADVGMVEREPKVEGRNLIVMILTPRKGVEMPKDKTDSVAPAAAPPPPKKH